MSEPKFENANGELSFYSLACGYIQVWNDVGTKKLHDGTRSVTLEMYAGCKVFNIVYRTGVDEKFPTIVCDKTVDSLVEARKIFRTLVREAKKGM